MKKLLFLSPILILGLTMCCIVCPIGDSPPTPIDDRISSFSGGVVINGVRWATRNVDAPGSFAVLPERQGMFFQWDRRKGWAATGDVADWDSTEPTNAYWARANDPCPVGWRIPTEQEFISLLEATTGRVFDSEEWHQYLARNRSSHWRENWHNTGVNGWILGTTPNFIFLPAVGFRNSRGVLVQVGAAGMGANYWISTAEAQNMGDSNGVELTRCAFRK